MTISIQNNDPRISYSVASGVTQTSFTIPFDFYSDSNVNVYVDDVLKVITADYTVSGGSGSTGTLTMSVTGASGTGSTVVILRNIPLDRTTDFPLSGPFNISSLNTELDRFVAITADQRDNQNQSITVPDAESYNMLLPKAADRAGRLVIFDEAGNVEVASEAAIGNLIVGANFITDVFTGDGSTVAFTLSVAANSKNNTQVHVDGVYQNKAGYSLNGAVVTFSEAPPLNAAIEVVSGDSISEGSTANSSAVDYNQGGVGAVNTTVQAKLQETVSVKDFGAVGDGATDDSAAIQAAIDTKSAVYFPDGTYLTSSTITFSGYEILFGSSSLNAQGGSVISYSGTGNAFANATPGTRIWDVNFKNIRVVATNASNAGDGLAFTDINRFTIENVWVQGFGGYGLNVNSTQSTGLAQCLVKNFYSFGNNSGVYVGSTVGAVADCTFSDLKVRSMGSTGYGIYIDSGSTRNMFTNCTYKQSSSNPLAGAIIVKSGAAGNSLIGCAGEVNQAVNEFEIESGASQNSLVGCFAQSRGRIIISDDSTMVTIPQLPHRNGYAFSYAQQVFSIANPANGAVYGTDFSYIGSDGATGSKYFVAPCDGQVIAMSCIRIGGSQTTGGSLNTRIEKSTNNGATWVTTNFTEIQVDATNDKIWSSDSDVTPVGFNAGDLLACPYKTLGWNGTGVYLITVIINYKLFT